jgi:hypothetical protein
MASLDLIESLGELRHRMSGLSIPGDYDDYMKTHKEILFLLRRLSAEPLDRASIAAMRLELTELLPLDPDFHGFVLELFERLGPPDEAMQELFLRMLDARGDRSSRYHMFTGDYLQLLQLLKNAGSPIPTLVGPLRELFEIDIDDGPVSVQETELQLRAAGLLLDWNGSEELGPALDDRCQPPSFRARVVELMKAEVDWRMHDISSPDQLKEVYSRLSAASAPFAQLVDRYQGRIRNGEKVLECPQCNEHGVFVSYLGIPAETIRARVRCEQCGVELILEITEEIQAPGHEEHARARFTLRSAG